MKNLLLILLVGLFSCGSKTPGDNLNTRLIAGPCEGCEAVLEYGEKELNPVDTLPDYNEEGIKIKITGTIYRNDGITPAENVILYIYHTDQQGIYATKGGEAGWAKRHGYIRGWVKTDSNGHYTFYTLRPGAYPNASIPAHIHPTILEPDGKYYWIESFHFEGDPFLTNREISPESPRGGNGLIKLIPEGGLLSGKRDIILGKNVPEY